MSLTLWLPARVQEIIGGSFLVPKSMTFGWERHVYCVVGEAPIVVREKIVAVRTTPNHRSTFLQRDQSQQRMSVTDLSIAEQP